MQKRQICFIDSHMFKHCMNSIAAANILIARNNKKLPLPPVEPTENSSYFVRYDKKLYGLAGAIHYLVENETTNIKSYKPIHHFFPVF